MEVLNLNIIPNGVLPVVHVKQYDQGREWRFNLFENANVFTLDGTEVIECDIHKRDGNIVTVAVTNTSDSYIDIETTIQMTACSGDQLGAIKITKGGDEIASINFIFSCQKSPLEGGITSDSAIHNLQQQIADAVADQYDADSVIFDNTGTAGHGIGYVVTSEGVLTMVNGVIALIPNNLNDFSDVDITNPTNGEILVYNNGSWENQTNPASTANFAPDYDDTQTYNTNDKVIYLGLLYVCLEDNVTGAWDSTKWQQITVADYNAEMLPIDALHPNDNTKEYIDGRTPIYKGGHATDLSTTGLSTGTYLYTYDNTTNGIPTANTEGNCFIVINDTQTWGCELAISNSGLFWRNKQNQVWGNWEDIIGKLTIHSGISTNPVDVDDTFQIPTAVLNHSMIVITFRRFGYGASCIVSREQILGGVYGTRGPIGMVTNNMFWSIAISNTGLITMKAKGDTTVPYIEVFGYF